MASDQQKALSILNTAIQMEKDGQVFYARASHESGSEAGRRLFTSLAEEEKCHQRRFEEIYRKLSRKQEWPEIKEASQVAPVRTIFRQATQDCGAETKTAASELDALKLAIDMESKSYDLYTRCGQEATSAPERAFYEALAAEERQHQLALTDYQEYLSDPADWFTNAEHHSLDGG